MGDVTARGTAAPVRGAAPRKPAAAAGGAAAGREPAKGRCGAVRKADARRLAVAATLALAVDVLALTLLSSFLSGMTAQADRDEETLWISLDLGPPVVHAAAKTAGTELTSGTELAEKSAPARPAVPERVDPETAPTSSDTGTELTLGTELSTSPGAVLAPRAGPEAGSAREAAFPGKSPPLGTELTTKEDLLHRLDEEITRNLNYPPRARARGIEGRVLLDLRVDEIGRLEDCSVEMSSGSALLDGAARRLITDIFPLHARLASSFSALVAVEYRLR